MTSLAVLNHEIHQVDNLYCLNDLHKASGGADKHKPSNFLRNQETKDLVEEIIDEKMGQCANLHSEKSDAQIRASVENSVLRVVKGNFGKAKQGAFACKEIVYRYAMWISPKFALVVIRVFDAIATGQTLQQQFLIADKEFKTATEIASHAGYTLNYVGKKVKPEKKQKRDSLFARLQMALPFFESKAV